MKAKKKNRINWIKIFVKMIQYLQFLYFYHNAGWISGKADIHRQDSEN